MACSRESLQRNELFKGLNQEEIDLLAPLCVDLTVPQDAMVFMEGTPARHLFLVNEGRVALQKSARLPHAVHARRTTIAVCGPGEVVGWSGIVPPHQYVFSGIAWEKSSLIRIDGDLLRLFLDQEPHVAFKVMEALVGVVSRRLRQATDALVTEREIYLSGVRNTA